MFEELIRLLPVAAVFAAVITVGLNAELRRRARRSATLQLHEFYLSPQFYASVRSPAYCVQLQWNHLPPDVRPQYRRIVVSGWAHNENADTLSAYAPDFPTSRDDIIKHHFQTPRALPSLTEHQALTALLRFWSRLNKHLSLHLIDRHVTRVIFRDEFEYNRTFFRELANEVVAAMPTTKAPPTWVKDLNELDVFFEKTTSRNANQG